MEIPPVEKPDHIPDAAVYDFDLFTDSQLLADPHERLQQMLRDLPPVFWTPRNFGHWIALSHEAVFEASRNAETFSSVFLTDEEMQGLKSLLPEDIGRIPRTVPISMDPPQHTLYRAPLQPSFSPKAVADQTDNIRTLANELLDKVLDQGHCDFIAAVAEPLPVTIFMRMMGLPLEQLGEFREIVQAYLAPGMSNPMEVLKRTRMIADAMADTINDHKQNPRDDLISLLWNSTVDGRAMDYDLMEDYCTLLFIAGLDTVINGMGYGVRHLARDPETQQRLRENPDQIPEAVDELLRRYTFTLPVRKVAKDTELGGQPLKQGEFLTLCLPAADLDPAAFSSPEQFDLDRRQKTHIAFGVGPHRCLGSHLARLELGILYEEVLKKLPTFRLDPDQPTKFRGGNILAVDQLPIRWD